MRIKYLIASSLLFGAASSSASAQLGGLIKKAKTAAATKVVDSKVAEVNNKNLKPSSTFGPELTEASLDAVIRGLGAAQAKLDEADQLRTARQRIDEAWSQSSASHEKDRQAYDDLRNKIEPCQDSVVSTRANQAQEAFMQKMQSDPAAQAKMMQAAMAASQQNAALHAKGDTAGLRRMVQDLAKAQGVDPKADSLVAIKVCGPVPAKPVWLVEQDSMRARSTRLDGQVRDAESGAQSAAVVASGLSIKDYSLARERVLHWSIEAHGGSPIQVFGADERKLLEARRGDIEKIRKALN